MSTDLDPISQALGTATGIASLPRPPAPVEKKESDEAPEIEDDYQEARSNLKELISQTMEQIPDLINLMSQSQSDKMISAVSSFVKTAADLNTSLSKLSKEIKRPGKGSPGKVGDAEVAPTQITNHHHYIGSTEDLLRMIAKQAAESKMPVIEAEYAPVQEQNKQ